MKVLIADDDVVYRRVLQDAMTKWGYDPVVCTDGAQAWQALPAEDAPKLLLLNWMMPKIEGVEICRRVRQSSKLQPIYIIMLTARDRKEDVVAGLQAGADDYITKPFNREELHARVQVAVRVLRLQTTLAEGIRRLEHAFARVKQLQGLLPICSYCKKIRDDRNYWRQVEDYIAEHSNVQFSHAICPECYQKYVKQQPDQSTHDGREGLA